MALFAKHLTYLGLGERTTIPFPLLPLYSAFLSPFLLYDSPSLYKFFLLVSSEVL